jgi:hypothetical protein
MSLFLNKQLQRVNDEHEAALKIKKLDIIQTANAKSVCTTLIASPKGIVTAFTLGVCKELATQSNVDIKKIAVKRLVMAGLANIA